MVFARFHREMCGDIAGNQLVNCAEGQQQQKTLCFLEQTDLYADI